MQILGLGGIQVLRYGLEGGRALLAELNDKVGKFKQNLLQIHFFLSLNVVNILPRSIDDENNFKKSNGLAKSLKIEWRFWRF